MVINTILIIIEKITKPSVRFLVPIRKIEIKENKIHSKNEKIGI
jgi:hypothetical protein